MNEQYIPVQINASHDPTIANALNIQSFPTIVLATADGKILKIHPGFMEAQPFHEMLQQALAALPKPKSEAVAERPEPRKATVTKNTKNDRGEEDASGNVQWRLDYNVARQEAQEKGRPIFLTFHNANNPACKELEKGTLRDPSIISLMNERFIPLRIDGDKDTALAQTLRISKYPTIVLAAPDGRILGTYESQLEASRLNEYLQRALASISSPDWMLRDYQAATKAVAGSDYARAVALLKGILEDGNDRPVQTKARQLMQDVEQQALGRLARAKQLDDKGQNTEAMETLTELVRVFAGTQAATDAGRMLSDLGAKPENKARQRTLRSRELLAQAREDYRTQQYLCCLYRCEILASSYPDLTEGNEGIQLAAEIKNNPEWMQRACDDLSDRLSLLYLAQAETWIGKGQPQQAVQCLEKVVQSFPGTRQAEAAQLRLSQIQGQPTRQADYKNR
jgi:thioredoxin-like negative regulator of GroEL